MTFYNNTNLEKTLIKYFIDKQWSIGETYNTLEWFDETIPKPSEEELQLKFTDLLKEEMIVKRNKLLRETDFKVLSDYPHNTQEDRDKWIQYRQQLRNFPAIWTPETEFPMPPQDIISQYE